MYAKFPFTVIQASHVCCNNQSTVVKTLSPEYDQNQLHYMYLVYTLSASHFTPTSSLISGRGEELQLCGIRSVLRQ